MATFVERRYKLMIRAESSGMPTPSNQENNMWLEFSIVSPYSICCLYSLSSSVSSLVSIMDESMVKPMNAIGCILKYAYGGRADLYTREGQDAYPSMCTVGEWQGNEGYIRWESGKTVNK
jgi:hypothetical protein